jgi:hypothetical protein
MTQVGQHYKQAIISTVKAMGFDGAAKGRG